MTASTIKIAPGTYTAMAVTNLANLANSQTVGWQSARVDNQTSALATNYEINVKLPMANTAPGNDKAVYVYAIPWITTDGGTTWVPGADLGTTTAPTGTDAAGTIALPPNAKLLGTLNYTTQNMTMYGQYNLCPAIGPDMPDGWSIVIINYSGAAIGASPVVSYRPINYTVG